MKNICFLDYDFTSYGGAEKVVCNISNHLIDYCNISIVSLYGKEKHINANISEKIKYIAINNGKDRIRKSVTSSFKIFKDYITQNNIDTVFVIGGYCIPLAIAVKPFVNKVKFVFCDHGALRNQLDDKQITLFRKLATKICDKVVVLTRRTMSDYKDLFKAKDSKIDCIYNWVDPDIFDYTAPDYNINSKKIITVGRFGPEKGYDMLVDVAKDVLVSHPDWSWDLFGDGETFQEIKAKIKENDLEKQLILKGSVDDIYDRYKNYAIYVLPSYREGLPLVLLEAKANHLPIVSFDCITGPREIVEDEKDGFLIECYNKQKMAQRLNQLIENDDLRKLFSDNSSNNLDKFNKDSILKQWIDLIENI